MFLWTFIVKFCSITRYNILILSLLFISPVSLMGFTL